MLSSIHLKNFKCYRDSTIVPLAPLTVLLGCNNSGKSTIIQALLALKYTLADRSPTARFVTHAPSLTLGGFFDFRHAGAKDDDTVSISLEREPQQRGPVTKLFGGEFRESTGLSLTFSANKSTNNIEVAHVAISDENGKVLVEADESGRWKFEGLAAQLRSVLGMRLINFLPDIIPIQPKKNGKKKHNISGDKLFGALTFSELQTRLWMRTFGDIEHIAPLRAHMPWYASATGRASSIFGAGGENLIHSLASKVAIRNGKILIDLVNDWLSTHMKIVNNLRIKNVDGDNLVWSLLADDPAGHRGINIAAMGEGISQSLPIVAAALSLGHFGCLAVEQPELHLHPAAQADFGDLFVDVAKDGSRQIMVETHSEHLLLRIRRRIAEGVIDPKHVAILFVNRKDGESHVTRLDLNERGHFDTQWPKGFFAEAYNEAMALAMAQPVE